MNSFIDFAVADSLLTFPGLFIDTEGKLDDSAVAYDSLTSQLKNMAVLIMDIVPPESWATECFGVSSLLRE